MKKLVRIVSLAAAAAVLPAVVSAQDKQFEVGTKIVNVGVLVAGESYGGVGLGAGLEVGVANIADGVVRLGVGGSIGYLRKNYGAGFGLYTNEYTFTSMPIVGFVNGHYQIEQVPKLDVYAGPVVGVARSTGKYEGLAASFNTSSNDVVFGVQAGARYELTSAIAGSLQLSGGSSQLPWANIGVAFKF